MYIHLLRKLRGTLSLIFKLNETLILLHIVHVCIVLENETSNVECTCNISRQKYYLV